MLGIIVWGAFLYAGATRLKATHALLVALGAAIALTGLGVAFMRNDPLCQGYPSNCSANAQSLAYNVGIKFVLAMLCYGVGRLGAAIYRRLRPAKDD